MKEDAVMSKAGVNFDDIKAMLMKDKDFKDEYEELQSQACDDENMSREILRNVTTKDIIKPNDVEYDTETGMPTDSSYFECGLPKYVQESHERMKESWQIVDSGKTDMNWDVCWCELSADLNSAEVENLISSEQAWYLRKKYLRVDNSI